ncbi:MAG: hypothetical protein RBU24_00730 [Kiritimatiellia bacterium]|jgi:hypothetical protein|nr:hypothetical protein [Kiritimatiellia bacterium]
MRVLEPITISSVDSGPYDSPTQPKSNVLLDAPGVYFASSVPVGNYGYINFETAGGSINSICLLGVSATGVDTIKMLVGPTESEIAPANLTTISIDDAYTGKRAIWYTFDATTETKWVIRIWRASGDPVFVIGCLKAGTTHEQTGVLYPLEEGLDDPTVQIHLADGSVYRGAQIAPARTFGATVRALRSEVEPFMATLRRIGGKPTMWHMAPDLGDYYFLYGRLAGMPQASHAWPVVSSASLAVREWI